MKYFCVFDEKARSFGQVFPSPTFGSAERSFKESVSNPESPHGKYPEDFSLYYVFDFDEDTAVISEVQSPPSLVIRATDLK